MKTVLFALLLVGCSCDSQYYEQQYNCDYIFLFGAHSLEECITNRYTP